MGKASRKKKDTVERRWKDKRCLHCGAARNIEAVWCHTCTMRARRKYRAAGYPQMTVQWPVRDTAVYEWLRAHFWNQDPRYRWPMSVEDFECELETGGPDSERALQEPTSMGQLSSRRLRTGARIVSTGGKAARGGPSDSGAVPDASTTPEEAS